MSIDLSNFLIAICAMALVALAVGVLIGYIVWQRRTRNGEDPGEYIPKYYASAWENGNHVVYIMDDPDPEEATFVIKVSNEGQQYSTTGINGPYTILS